jgi:hypothetical protein
MAAGLLASLLVALTGAAAVGSILLVTALLASDGGRASVVGYLLGYVGAYTAIGAAVVAARLDARTWTSGEAGQAGPIALVILGVVLAALGVRTALGTADRTSLPAGTHRRSLLDRATPARAFGLGAAVALVNVKNLALFLTAITVLQASAMSDAAQLAAAPLVALVFCLGPFVPLVIDVAAPRRSARALAALRHGVQRYGRQLGTWLPLLVGIAFVARGVRGLT